MHTQDRPAAAAGGDARNSVGEPASPVGGLRREDLQRFLLEADRARFGSEEERAHAAQAYLTLRAWLEPDRPEDAARLLWLHEWLVERTAERTLAHCVSDEGAVREVAERAAAVLLDPERRALAELGLAEAAGHALCRREQEERYRRVLDARRGTGGQAERAACRRLAGFYAGQRREFEALVMAHKALTLVEAAGPAVDPWERCETRLRACDAIQAIEDEERMPAAVAAIEEALDACRGDPRAWRAEHFVHATRFEGAVASGDVAGARRELARMRAAIPEGTPPPGDPRWLAHCEASLALAAGDPREALRRVEEVRGLPVVRRGAVLAMDLLEVRCLAETGAREAAVVRSRDLVRALDPDVSRGVLSTGRRIRDASRLGTLLLEKCGNADAAHVAFELAAGAVLERILEVDRCVREMPEMADIGPENLRMLAEYRARYAAEHADLLRRVADALAPRIHSGHGPFAALEGTGGLLRVCAWCSRVKEADGTWLPVGQYLPADFRLRVTHGMCEECHAALLRTAG